LTDLWADGKSRAGWYLKRERKWAEFHVGGCRERKARSAHPDKQGTLHILGTSWVKSNLQQNG